VLAGDTPVLVHNTGCGTTKRPLVIGENMERVKKYAAENGYQVWKPRRGGDEADLLRRNQRMIEDAKRDGRQIIDIGPDFTQRRGGEGSSIFYNLERKATAGYGGYTKVFVRDGKVNGGVPGFD